MDLETFDRDGLLCGRLPTWANRPGGNSDLEEGVDSTEPELDHDKLPLLLVDTATRQGMSGSPGVLRHSGVHMPSGEFTDDTVFGTVENLLGIYSGRIGDDELHR